MGSRKIPAWQRCNFIPHASARVKSDMDAPRSAPGEWRFTGGGGAMGAGAKKHPTGGWVAGWLLLLHCCWGSSWGTNSTRNRGWKEGGSTGGQQREEGWGGGQVQACRKETGFWLQIPSWSLRTSLQNYKDVFTLNRAQRATIREN